MRLVLKFELENEIIPKDYRRGIISLIKSAYTKNADVNNSKYYNNEDPIMKSYAFATRFQMKSSEGESFVLNRKDFEVVFTTNDVTSLIETYNSFLAMRFREMPFFNNKVTLKNVVKLKDYFVKDSEIVVKFMSPLLVRDYKDKNKYHLASEPSFMEALKANLKYQYQDNELSNYIESLQIERVVSKKTVVIHYGNYIDGNNGIFKLTGNSRLLNDLYHTGIGSRRSAGFGVFEVV